MRLLGALPRAELVRVQQSGWLNLYPCRFPEMFCISAAESAAAGTPMITSPLEALAERVQDGETGRLVGGSIDEPATHDRLAEATIALLGDGHPRQVRAHGH